MRLLSDFRAAVGATLAGKLPTPTPLWDAVPDDVAELPCVVIGLPSSRQTSTAVVFDLALDVIVVGRRQDAGDAEEELVALADEVWTVLGGTRGTKQDSVDVAVRSVDPRVVTIAGLDVSAYVVSVESSAATC